MKRKQFLLLLTEDQEKILEAKAKASGFFHKSEYIRFVLFVELSVMDKINVMYEKVMKNAK